MKRIVSRGQGTLNRAARGSGRKAACALRYGDSLALQAARDIEDIFAQSHVGGRTQRLAKIQVVIMAAMNKLAKAAGARTNVGSEDGHSN